MRGDQGMLSVEQMRIVLAAFQGCEDVKTFSNPKVIVTSGKEAIVDMTKKFPNVVSSAKRVLNGNNNTLDVDTRMMEIPGRDNLMFAQGTGRPHERRRGRDVLGSPRPGGPCEGDEPRIAYRRISFSSPPSIARARRKRCRSMLAGSIEKSVNVR